MICANSANLPTWIEALSGNTADTRSFPDTIQAYLAQFGEDEETPLLVATKQASSSDGCWCCTSRAVSGRMSPCKNESTRNAKRHRRPFSDSPTRIMGARMRSVRPSMRSSVKNET